ncbi:S-4TM family putative pore-forming effector [Agrobacterium salinitolerans]|uniref:S-4TM family putative pore-forming effector n=1 Tax=Agrobacterium salinitolerans TaxID=1183413 RepID=UPI003FD42FEC
MIADRQNEKRAIDFMKARQNVWARAKMLLLIQIFASVLLPAAFTVGGLLYPNFKPIAATVAIFISIMDLALLDRAYKSLIGKAAKFGEEFDIFVFDIPWNAYICGARPDHESVVEEAAAFDKKRAQDRQQILDWYPVIFREVPLPIARFMCQRTNVWYDSTMRKRYATWILAAIVIVCGYLLCTALLNPLPLGELVLTYLAPLSPLLLWSVREYFRQRDTASSQDTIKKLAESLWSKAADGTTSDLADARHLQDAIYLRRSNSPLIFPGLYSAMRTKLEVQMKAGAEKMVEDYKTSYSKENFP